MPTILPVLVSRQTMVMACHLLHRQEKRGGMLLFVTAPDALDTSPRYGSSTYSSASLTTGSPYNDAPVLDAPELVVCLNETRNLFLIAHYPSTSQPTWPSDEETCFQRTLLCSAYPLLSGRRRCSTPQWHDPTIHGIGVTTCR